MIHHTIFLNNYPRQTPFFPPYSCMFSFGERLSSYVLQQPWADDWPKFWLDPCGIKCRSVVLRGLWKPHYDSLSLINSFIQQILREHFVCQFMHQTLCLLPCGPSVCLKILSINYWTHTGYQVFWKYCLISSLWNSELRCINYRSGG